MGLDIYLARVEDYERMKELERETEALSDLIWEEVAESMGCSRSDLYKSPDDGRPPLIDEAYVLYLNHPRARELQEMTVELNRVGANTSYGQPHPKYPDHSCNLGYIRSSYNPSGFDSVCREWLDGEASDGLYYIFGVESYDACMVQPNWRKVASRAREVQERLRECREYTGESRVMFVSGNTPGPSSMREAMQVFQDAMASAPEGDYAFSRGSGTLFGESPDFKVRAVILGTDRGFMGEGSTTSGAYVVYTTGTDAFTYHIQTCDIIVAMAEMVLEMTEEEQSKHYLVWSA